MRYRYARRPDFRQCLELAQTDPVPYGGLLTKLPDIWRELLDDHRMIPAVVETGSGDVICFGASVFVDPKWAADLLLKPRPYPAIEAYESLLDGSHVVLDLDEITRRNSVDGLVLLCLHGITDPGLQHDVLLEGRRELSQAFLHFHTGFRIREAIMECYSLDYLSLCLANGLQLRSRQDSPPYLIGHTKAEALDSGVMFAAAVFAYRRPRFGFSIAQQDVLGLALTRLSEQEIASALFISEHALKKRWEQIFERVNATDLTFFPEMPTHGAGRGPEKRTRLLNYLADHREELRPHDPNLVHSQSR